jgi:CubicO group peptidase (beta-lactamase class C family)
MRNRYWVCLLIVLIGSLVTSAVAAPQAEKAKAQLATGRAAKQAVAQPARPPLEGFDAFVEEKRKEWKVPGLAIAVVHDGKVVHAKGYGSRDVERQLPVTPRTLFAIGSITKSFTVTLLGMLAEEGKLDWDRPVREYLPDFRLNDLVATERMTPLDLVTHRSGLPRHDLLWYGSSFTRREMYHRLRYLEPSRDFRQLYQYNNLMYLTAGILAEEIGRAPWEEQVRRRILEPLGMSASNFSVNDSQRAEDFAQPYMEIKKEITRVPFRNLDAIGPAGSINSNVEEMIRYVQLHLNRGKHGEKALISEATAARMQTAQMVVPPGDTPYTEAVNVGYGMGFLVGVYRGHKVVAHGGGIDGFTALLAFLPNDKLGMIILTNRSGTPLTTVVARNVFDRMLGLEPIDWSQRLKEQEEKDRKAQEEARAKAAIQRRSGTRPSHELKEYAGEYEHPGYGLATIRVDGEKLLLTFNDTTLPLEHFHFDYFEVGDTPRETLKGSRVQFFTNAKGEVGSFSIPLQSGVADIVFSRRVEKQTQERTQPTSGEAGSSAAVGTVLLESETAAWIEVGESREALARGRSRPAKPLTQRSNVTRR